MQNVELITDLFFPDICLVILNINDAVASICMDHITTNIQTSVFPLSSSTLLCISCNKGWNSLESADNTGFLYSYR
jgi:hypothetical protein